MTNRRKSGFDKAALLARAQSDHVEAVYRENTVQAQNLGVFGAPSFMVGSEIFWGDDRLEDAISFLKVSLAERLIIALSD